MTRIPADPNATPEQNAARIVQNGATVFAERAERFASLLERHAEDLDDERREAVEQWVRKWANRLVNATQPERRTATGLQLFDDAGTGAPAPPEPESTEAKL